MKKAICMKIGLSVMAILILPFVGLSEAQQTAKVHRVGILASSQTSPESPSILALREQLRELGYIEGENITIEFRSAEGIVDRVPDLAAELVRLKVDVIVTSNTTVVRTIRQITDTTPIVMVGSSDRPDIVATPAKPGGNVTGSSVNREISGKQLELLKETFPRLTHVAVLLSAPASPKRSRFQEAERAARALGLEVRPLEVRSAEDLENAFQPPHIGPANGLLVIGSPLFNTHRKQVIALAEKNRLPAIYPDRTWTKNGGLMSYGPDYTAMWRRAAFHVDKILKGAKPADLPVEQPMKFEMVINLKAAKKIALVIPPEVLMWADEVIK